MYMYVVCVADMYMYTWNVGNRYNYMPYGRVVIANV